jgi:hypothetical protein
MPAEHIHGALHVVQSPDAYNYRISQGSDMQQDDPLQNRVPTGGGALTPAAGNRFTPSPLSYTSIAFLKRSLARNQLRRSVYRAGHLRVYIDGAAHVPFGLEAGVSKSFRVPLSASYLEISGDDSEGELLLGVFLLPVPAQGEDDQPQHLSVTLEGGQTVAMEIRVGDGPCRGVPEYVMQISYAEASGREIRSGLNRHIVWADEQQSQGWVWDIL